jgi:hypothetical protein
MTILKTIPRKSIYYRIQKIFFSDSVSQDNLEKHKTFEFLLEILKYSAFFMSFGIFIQL